MNTLLKEESKVENITLTGVIDGANVRLSFSRDNKNPVRQITVNADKTVENGTPVNLFVDWQPANRSLTIAAYNCGLDDVPMDLIGKLLAEVRTVK